MLVSASLADDVSAPSTFTLWQLPNQTPVQMMSYAIRTPGGKVAAIDGGNAGDAPYLAKFIAGLGNRVDAWFLTHPHSDHTDALAAILQDMGEMRIGTVYASMPDGAWMAQHASELERASDARLRMGLDAAGLSLTELQLGQEIRLDGVLIEVLGVWNPELTVNAVNDQSIILRVSDAGKSVLFTGDLGVQGGEKARAGPYADRLHADYIQMAHHGQQGVNEAFYQHVGATYCLWPTPKWLWDNDNGGGPNSGPWKTLEVRAWMEKLPIKRHFLGSEGLQRID